MTTRVLSLGDSWFHYPKGLDRDGNILVFNDFRELISKGKGVGNIPFYLVHKFAVHIDYEETTPSSLIDPLTHNVESHDDNFGVCGEELTEMIYGRKRREPVTKNSDINWMNLLIKRVEWYLHTYGVDNVIILLSGGGNDMVDENLIDFVVPNGSKWSVNREVLTEEIDKLMEAWRTLFSTLENKFPQLKFNYIIHGYDNPPVNGRGLITHDAYRIEQPLQKLGIGPWISKTLLGEKYLVGNQTSRTEAENIIKEMLEVYNQKLELLSNSMGGKLRYLDLRNKTIPNLIDEDWANELHYGREKYIQTSQLFKYEIEAIINDNTKNY